MGGLCCSSYSVQPSGFTANEKENFFYKLASPKEIREANELTVAPTRTIVGAPKLLNKLRKFNCTGRITMEKGTNFWMIILDKNWQDRQDTLQIEFSNEPGFLKTEFIDWGCDQGKKWADLMGLKGYSPGWFTPTSIAGMHISLGVFKPEDKPESLVEGKEVNFSITSFTTLPNVRSLPIFHPGIRTFKKGDITLMHCPTLWIFMDVDVMDFDFNFKYPPHVSLACYGLKFVPLKAVTELHESLKAAGCRGEYEYGKE